MRTAYVLVVAALVVGCMSVAGTPTVAPTVPPTQSQVVIYVTPPPTVAPPTPAPTIAPTPAPTSPPSADGSRENPYPLGKVATVGDWRVVIASIDHDAWSQIREENMFNEPPAAGFQFVMFEAEVTYRGTGTGTAWLDLSWAVVGTRGNTFGEGAEYSCGVIPGDMLYVGDLYTGASARGNVCVPVESDQLDGATIRVRSGFLVDEDVFFEVSEQGAVATPDPLGGLTEGYIDLTIEQIDWLDTLSEDADAIVAAGDPWRPRRLRVGVSDALEHARSIQTWLLVNPPDSLCYSGLHGAWGSFIGDYVDGLDTLDYGLTPPITYDDVYDGLDQVTVSLELIDVITSEIEAVTCI